MAVNDDLGSNSLTDSPTGVLDAARQSYKNDTVTNLDKRRKIDRNNEVKILDEELFQEME